MFLNNLIKAHKMSIISVKKIANVASNIDKKFSGFPGKKAEVSNQEIGKRAFSKAHTEAKLNGSLRLLWPIKSSEPRRVEAQNEGCSGEAARPRL